MRAILSLGPSYWIAYILGKTSRQMQKTIVIHFKCLAFFSVNILFFNS